MRTSRSLEIESAKVRAIHHLLWGPGEWSADTSEEIGRLVPRSPRPSSPALKAIHRILWKKDAEWDADSLEAISRVVPRGSVNRAVGVRPRKAIVLDPGKGTDGQWQRVGKSLLVLKRGHVVAEIRPHVRLTDTYDVEVLVDGRATGTTTTRTLTRAKRFASKIVDDFVQARRLREAGGW